MARSRFVHDRDLLDSLERFETTAYAGEVWRTAWATRDPLIANSAGGRWNPPDSFDALYTSLERDSSLAEIYHHLSRAPVFSSSNVRVFRIQVKTKRTLRLPDMETLGRLGVDTAAYGTLDHERCQEIGRAAYLLEFDSLIVPSARHDGMNMVLFVDRLTPDVDLNVVAKEEVNWPAWRERTKD